MAYGDGLENRFRFFGERGFESHPLRGLAGEGLTGTLLRNEMDGRRQVAFCTIKLSVVLGS